MFKDFIALFELYVAYRILAFVFTACIFLFCALAPTWLISIFFMTCIVVALLSVPFAVIWAVLVMVKGMRSHRRF
jgi:hypothetical protein